MKIAIVENQLVTNVVEGKAETVAELFELSVPQTDLTNTAWIGARFNGKKFEPIKIYESWTWNESEFTYEPPAPKPDGDYYWSEAELDWLVIPEPEEEPLG